MSILDFLARYWEYIKFICILVSWKTQRKLSYKSLSHTLLREISFQSTVNVAALALLTSSQTGLKVKAAAAAAGQPLLGEAGWGDAPRPSVPGQNVLNQPSGRVSGRVSAPVSWQRDWQEAEKC